MCTKPGAVYGKKQAQTGIGFKVCLVASFGNGLHGASFISFTFAVVITHVDMSIFFAYVTARKEMKGFTSEPSGFRSLQEFFYIKIHVFTLHHLQQQINRV